MTSRKPIPNPTGMLSLAEVEKTDRLIRYPPSENKKTRPITTIKCPYDEEKRLHMLRRVSNPVPNVFWRNFY